MSVGRIRFIRAYYQSRQQLAREYSVSISEDETIGDRKIRSYRVNFLALDYVVNPTFFTVGGFYSRDFVNQFYKRVNGDG